MKVIVVEDEDRIREGILGLLEIMDDNYEAAGYAENGKAGLELIWKERPDIVITDVRMPDMSGLDMLSMMRKEGIEAKVIILSAYSEFEYARQAMRMGVTEYLLKPVSIDEFSRAMNAVKIQISKEKSVQPKMLGTLEQTLGAVLYGQLEPDAAVEEYLKKQYGMDAGGDIAQICVYLGDSYSNMAGKAEKEWRMLLNLNRSLRFCIIRANYERSIVILVIQCQNLHELEKRIQCLMLQGQDGLGWQGCVGWIVSEGIADIKKKFELIYSYMDWSITLGKDVLIAYPKILQIQTSVFVYPMELENRLKTDICQGNFQRAYQAVESLHTYFSRDKVFMPKDVKECYIRFIWAMIYTAREVGMLNCADLNQKSMLDRVMGAKLFAEIKETIHGLMEQIQMSSCVEDAASHLTVRRVKSMIHEFY